MAAHVMPFLPTLPPIAGLEHLQDRLKLHYQAWFDGTRRTDLQLIRDQLKGGRAALSSTYHPDLPGLSEVQQERVRKARKHVNFAAPALDRLVNSIHAGKIRRGCSDPSIQAWIRRPEHSSAMVTLCEHAFAYGTGYLVPLFRQRKSGAWSLRYWHPNPLNTVILADPLNCSEVEAIVEFVCLPGTLTPWLTRWMTKNAEGWQGEKGKEPVVVEHGLGFVPAVLAYGRTQFEEGTPYGQSLILAAAEASISVTNNNTNLELLRDDQTRALLIIKGEPTSTSAENKQVNQRYLVGDGENFDAKFIQPQSTLQDIMKLSAGFARDCAVSTGLPADTFDPDIVRGSDASATAALQRAFPLSQRMVRLSLQWRETELRAIAMIAALWRRAQGGVGAMDLEDLMDEISPSCSIMPAVAEREAETLSNFQQATEKFYRPVEDAIEYYSGELPEEEKAGLAERWKSKFDPLSEAGEVYQYHVEGGVLTVNEVRRRLGLPEVPWGEVTVPQAKASPASEDDLLSFKRDVARALYGGATTKEVLANLTNLGELVEQVGLPRELAYQEPWLPVVAPSGLPITGGVVRDAEGSIVGGEVAAVAAAGIPV